MDQISKLVYVNFETFALFYNEPSSIYSFIFLKKY